MSVAVELETEMRRLVTQRSAHAQAQRKPGVSPSALGNQCDRFLGMLQLLDAPPSKYGHLAEVGTAWHAQMEAAALLDNERLGRTRWLVEERVYLTDGLSGSCDLFDLDNCAPVDHKLLGKTKIALIKQYGAPPKYRVQLHGYGLGWVRAGYVVRDVVLVAWPRNDDLEGSFAGQGLYVWSEPYDESIALGALERLNHITQLCVELAVDEQPANWQFVPANYGPDCKYCPFFNPELTAPTQAGCPGRAPRKQSQQRKETNVHLG